MELFEVSNHSITEEGMWTYDRCIGNCSWYIRHIIIFLRLNKELLKDPDYNRLYEECIVYLNKYHNRFFNAPDHEYSESREAIELLADLYNKYPEAPHYTMLEKEEVEHFLAFRKKAWDQ